MWGQSKITPPDRLNSNAKIEQLRNQFIAVDPKLKGKIDYEGIRNFQVIRRAQYGTQHDVNKAIFGPDWKNIQQDPHLLKRIVQNDDVQQLLDEQQEQHLLMMSEIQNKMQKTVKQNEGIRDPRFSDIQSSLPPKIIPNRIARESDFNIDDRLAQPSARTGNAAMPPDPDIIVREMSHEGHQGAQVAEQIYKQQDGEQVPTQALPEEDAIQQRLDEQDNQQPNQQAIQQITNQFNEVGGVKDQPPESASQFMRSKMQQGQAKDQMSEEVQELNDEIIQGLKYVVGATGWGKEPINQFYNQQHFPDRKYQWYTNEGQTVLRQAQVKLDKQSLLNMPRKKKNYISQGELSKTLKGQKQLRKKK
ncbi:MAG: hypothetical protein EZS28_031905 [Streblomastix strix]|uniref:Uncharacterized protein n=1 Tax=Streblomastix strix TaxID=222440 RepID=A0A5J4UQ94_9EUKA|nr:MAG: hypothetical protein EZS28_031905 [Streblomastix strix]